MGCWEGIAWCAGSRLRRPDSTHVSGRSGDATSTASAIRACRRIRCIAIRSLSCRVEVDLARFNEEAAALLGLRDFGAFCRGREGASTIRTLLELSGRRVGSGPMAGVIECTVRADAFCHSMVRSLVGALVAVATGRRDHEWLAELMARAVRDSTIMVMPAHGLTLEEVGYPADHELAARAREARAVRQLSRS